MFWMGEAHLFILYIGNEYCVVEAMSAYLILLLSQFEDILLLLNIVYCL